MSDDLTVLTIEELKAAAAAESATAASLRLAYQSRMRTANRLTLAGQVLALRDDVGFDDDAVFTTHAWRGEGRGDRFDMAVVAVRAANGDLVHELDATDAVPAGDRESDESDWDLFLVDDAVDGVGPLSFAKVVRWAAERMSASPMEGDDPALAEEVFAAQRAAHGDSNDEEIDLLRSALEMALGELGYDLPRVDEPDYDED